MPFKWPYRFWESDGTERIQDVLGTVEAAVPPLLDPFPSAPRNCSEVCALPSDRHQAPGLSPGGLSLRTDVMGSHVVMPHGASPSYVMLTGMSFGTFVSASLCEQNVTGTCPSVPVGMSGLSFRRL